MKSLITVIIQLVKDRPSRMNVLALIKFLMLVIGLIIFYSIVFHYIMEYEGRSESWITGVYWTLTVMSTLGFGDITFQSDVGRLFSTVVLISGVIFLLVLLPFTFIEFFYTPWIKAQQAARAPVELPESTKGHIVLTKFDTVTKTLIEKLRQYQYTYVIIIPDLVEALRLHDLGYVVMRGDLDDPDTYWRAQVDQALFVASTASDQVNANVAFTVREISEKVPVIATANTHASVDILELAGCNKVLQLAEMTGEALARQVGEGASVAYTIGQFENLMIAEATARSTPLVGKTIQESRLRELVGLNIVGVWERGFFEIGSPETVITPNTVLVMAGLKDHIDLYNDMFSQDNPSKAPVIIIGGGRVGRIVGENLTKRGLDYRIVEKSPTRIRNKEKYILGDAAELEVLEDAGIHETNCIVVTTHDDDMNVYLTIYCRRLRPDVQIIARADLERNIPTLHRAGADFVLSYASTGANAIINYIGRDNILMVAEGLDIFEVDIPKSLEGKTIADSEIRERTGCTIVGIHLGNKVEAMPNPDKPLPENCKLILIGSRQAEEEFLRLYK